MADTQIDQSCSAQIHDSYNSRINDIRQLWTAYQNGEEKIEDLGTFCEYGLCFDYVAAGTFTDQKRGYFRYQISYGGPSEEFRFYTDSQLIVNDIEFWYLNWFDGACYALTRRPADYDLMEEIFEFFRETETLEAELEKATE